MKKPISVIFDEITSDEKLIGVFREKYSLSRSDILYLLEGTKGYLENNFITVDYNHALKTFHKYMEKAHMMPFTVQISRNLLFRFIASIKDGDCSAEESIVSFIKSMADRDRDLELDNSCPMPITFPRGGL